MSQLIFRSSPPLIKHLMPMFAALLMATHLQFLASKSTAVADYFFTLVVVAAFSLPMFIAHWVSRHINTLKQCIYWLQGFIVYPVGLITSKFLFPDLLATSLTVDGFLIFISLSVISKLVPIMSRFFERNNKSKYLQKIKFEHFFMLVCLSVWCVLMMFANTHEKALTLTSNTIVLNIELGFSEFKALFWSSLQALFIAFLLWIIYWLNSDVLIYQLLGKYGLFTYLCGVLIYLLVITPFAFALIYLLPVSSQQLLLIPANINGVFQAQNYMFCFALISLSTPIVLLCRHHRRERKLFELERQNKQAELTLLQQQINPHFLFNTLNNIYGKVLCKSDDAPTLIEQLSSLLQHSVYKGQTDFVSLTDELAYISHFIELQKVRLHSKVTLNVSIQTWQDSQLRIAPLLLIVPIENAFKHSVEHNEHCEINIDCKIEHGRLTLVCENTLPPPIDKCADRQSMSDIQHGIGLINLKKRLSLIYNQTHQLNYGIDGQLWRVTLTIELT